MVQNLKNRNVKFIISGLVLLIITAFFFLNQNFYKKNKIEKNYSEFKTEFSNIHSLLTNKFEKQFNKVTSSVKKGQSLNSILTDAGASQQEIFEISKVLKKFINLKTINTNQVFEILTHKDTGEIIRLTINLDNINSLHVFRKNKEFVANKIEKVLFKKTTLAEGMINSSMYQAAEKEKIDPEVIVNFAGIFGFEIDFQRDIRRGDIFQIVYDKYVDDDGELQKNGDIIYAYMKNNGREIALYRFVDNKGIHGYYRTNGKSIEKALMKTPINGARLSSTFGMRKHPILGYNKMHRGTDFAAPTGTSIMASGSGIIEQVGWNGAYGKYIRIKHNSKYKTAYAHLNGYARGIKKGVKVRQGQIIGYVGSTGRSTGPHLHYEVLVNGKRMNSQRLKLPSGRTLRGEDREKFEISRIKIDVMRSNLIN
jgi:murein DD-endopeptidase MepM/ murein hydrolase activator NlpD